MNRHLLTAFCDELEKLGATSESEQRRRRHEYYVANRAKMIQRGRTYRQQNRVQLARKKRIYNRKVKMGTKRQRRRVQTGGMSFSYQGYK